MSDGCWLCPPAGGNELVLTGLAAGVTHGQLVLGSLRGAGLIGNNLTLLRQANNSSCSGVRPTGANSTAEGPCKQQVVHSWPANGDCDPAAAWGPPSQGPALSRGALAGVCVAAAVVASLLVAAAVLAYRRARRRRKHTQQESMVSKDTLPPPFHLSRSSRGSGIASEACSRRSGLGLDVAAHKDVEAPPHSDSLSSKSAAAAGSGGAVEPLPGSSKEAPPGSPAAVSSAGTSSAAGSSSKSASDPGVVGAARLHTAVSSLTRVMQQRRLQNHLARQRAGAADAGSIGPGSLGGTGGVVEAHTGVATGGTAQVGSDDVILQGVLGRGSFATVYSGIWRGRLVAVKLLHLPSSEALQQLGPGSGANQTPSNTPRSDAHHPSSGGRGSSGPTRLTRMAVMEAAISSAMRHPNIVQVFSYSLHAVGQSLQDSTSSNLSSQPGGGGPTHASGSGSQVLPGLGWELRLVMEYCDKVGGSAVEWREERSRGMYWGRGLFCHVRCIAPHLMGARPQR